MSKIGYNQKGNPFNRKNSPLNEKKNSAFTNYIDWDGDGKAEGWEYALEGVTWIPTVLAAAGTSPSGPGAIAAGAATKAGVTGLLKEGVKKIAKSKIGKWLTLGDRPKTTMVISGLGKTNQIADAKKTTEMQNSGYQNTEDLPENENSTNIFDK